MPHELKSSARWRRAQDRQRRWEQLGLTPQQWAMGLDTFARLLSARNKAAHALTQQERDYPHFISGRRYGRIGKRAASNSSSAVMARELLAAMRSLPNDKERVDFADSLLDSTDPMVKAALRHADLDGEVSFFVEEFSV